MAMAGGQMYTKTLTVVDGKNALVSRTIIQMRGMGPMEMPALAGQGTQQSTPTDIRDSADKVGTESVTTPGGTFDCDHYRAKDGSWDEWISAQVSPWGLVKLTSTRFGTITVSKVVTDAKDHITGTPQPFDPKQMGRAVSDH
jgi:hypothetical protein